jgi:DNA-directed RNA polymerase specialized sigma24 family protein
MTVPNSLLISAVASLKGLDELWRSACEDCSLCNYEKAPAEAIQVSGAVSGLEPRTRDVLICRFLLGVSEESIARRRGYSLPFVSAALMEGLNQVHRQLCAHTAVRDAAADRPGSTE